MTSARAAAKETILYMATFLFFQEPRLPRKLQTIIIKKTPPAETRFDTKFLNSL